MREASRRPARDCRPRSRPARARRRLASVPTLLLLTALVLSPGCGRTGERAAVEQPSLSGDARTPPPDLRVGDCGRADQCLAGYDLFIKKAAEHSSPTTRDDLWASLWAIIDESATLAGGIPEGSSLAAELLRESNADWLLAEAEKGQAAIVECEETLWGPAKQITLCIDDPWVGTFKALLLLPGIDGPYPAIVAHPGHAESAAYHRDYRLGRELLEAGYVLAVLEPRAFAGDEFEHAITERLLLQGHTLVGLRLYELAVLHRYLASLPEVDGDHIGLMGHSGGSDPTSLAAFIDPRWQATAIDIVGWFMARIDDNKQLSSEVSPRLWRWHRLIETTTPPVPRLRQDYGFPLGAGPLIEFFDRHLKPGSAPPQPPR